MLLLMSLLRIPAQESREASPQTPTATTSGADFRTQVEKQTFLIVNEYRSDHDFPPLTWSDAVAHEARQHSQDMATGKVDFGHDGFRDRVAHLSGVMSIQGAGENVLMTDNPDDVAHMAVKLWLASPHHLKNIRGDYNYSGLGVWQDKDGVIYFTQLFIKSVAPPAASQAAAAAPQVQSPFGFLASPIVSKH
jgi:uncharacterized protein YkwD